MATLMLVRHGESQWNLENRFTGWVNIDLTAKGREEARSAGEKLRGYHFDMAFTSVLKRAIDTLKIIIEVSGWECLPIEYNQALNERHYGELQGLNKAETAQKMGEDQVKLWRRSYTVRPPGGESLRDTANRVMPYYQSHILPELMAGKNILVVAHGNSLRSLVMHLDQLSEQAVIDLNIPTGIPLQYEVDLLGSPLNHRYL